MAQSHLPETFERRGQAIDLRFELRNSLLPLGKLDQTLDLLREAEAVAKVLDDKRRLGWVYCHMSSNFFLTSRCEAAVEFAERSLAISKTIGDFQLELMAGLYLGQAYHGLGDYTRAVGFCRRSVASLEGEWLYDRIGQDTLPSVWSRTWLVFGLIEQGAFAEGLAIGEEAVRIAEAVNGPFERVQALYSLGLLHLQKADVRHAIPLFEQCVESCREMNISIWSLPSAIALGLSYALSGQTAEAMPFLDNAAKQTDEMSAMPHHAGLLGMLSHGYLLTGHAGVAKELAVRALALARAHRHRGSEAWGLRLLGEIASRRDPPDVQVAEDSYRRALTLAAELGMHPLVAHCHVGLSEFYRSSGDGAKVDEHFGTAVAMYREMGLEF